MCRGAKNPGHKWAFAIGTTSRVPHSCPVHELSSDPHYLILDIDGPAKKGQYINDQEIWEPTANGWHVYSNQVFLSLDEMLFEAGKLGADRAWIRIARKRGYAFLADYRCVQLPWPVERMIIGNGSQKEKLNSRLGRRTTEF